MEQEIKKSSPEKVKTLSFRMIVLLIILAIIIGGTWLISDEPNDSALPQTRPTLSVQKNKIGAIEWIPLADTMPIRTIDPESVARITPNSFVGDMMLIFKIGDINEGEYKGKIIALGVSKNSYFEFNKSTNGTNLYNYGYFVADESGNPVAWNKDFIHNPDDRCNDIDAIGGCENIYYTNLALGLADDLKKPLNFIPKELGKIDYIITTNKKAHLKINYVEALASRNKTSGTSVVVDKSESGLDIVKMSDSIASMHGSILPAMNYFIALPFGEKIQISLEPDFIDSHDVPKISWTIGTKPVASYRYGNYAYGWQDCYDGISRDQFNEALVETGKNINNESIYEINSQKYPKVYQCLHEKTKRYVYDATSNTGNYVETVSYDDFVLSHPMFFWKHQLGDLIVFVRNDVVPSAEKAKPVIYLYPEKTEKINVKVLPLGGFTVTDPEYGDINGMGWVVSATPEGIITNIRDNKQYPYLFWEGGKEGVVETPKQGFVVSKENIHNLLDEKLSLFGLNDKERADFLEFWVPKLSQSPYYFITFISRSEIDRVAPLFISPSPESLIRVLMDYRPLSTPIKVDPLIITPTERSGFTVVDWGGIVH